MNALTLSLGEALDMAGGLTSRRIGHTVGVAAVVIDGTGCNETPPPMAEIANLATRLARLPAVTIATDIPDAATTDFDIVTDDPELFVSAILAHPISAVTAAQVLRMGERLARLSLSDGLLVESLAYSTLQSGPEHRSWLTSLGRRVRKDLEEPRVLLLDEPGKDHLELILRRPRLHNLMDAAMRDQLGEALRTIAAVDPPKPVRWRADGPSFCAGGDPAEFGQVADSAHAHLIRCSANVASLLAAVADRITVTIDGPAVGAGIELASFCAVVQATENARFRLPELTMGLIPGAGGTVSIPRRIGRRRTLEWLLLDLELDAGTALDWGLVDRLA